MSTTIDSQFRYYQARSAWELIDFRELWRFRELIWSFAIRDLKVRYRQTAVGVAWALLQPLVTIFVFGVLFRVMNATAVTSGQPYALVSLCGLLPWQLFSATLTQSTQSIVVNKNLVTKVYFPRVILPISSLLPALVDFLVAFGLMVLLMLYYGIMPGPEFLLLPLMTLFAMLTSLAFALWFAALNAIYRDVGYVVPFLLQSGLFISPTVYESSVVLRRLPEGFHWLYWLNPMVGVIEGFRWVILGGAAPPVGSMLVSFLVVALFFVGGLFYFQRMERFFADRV